MTKYEEKTVENTVEKIAKKPASVRQRIYLDMNSSTDDDDTDDEMPPLEEDNMADVLQKIRESPTHEEKLKMDESAQWHSWVRCRPRRRRFSGLSKRLRS